MAAAYLLRHTRDEALDKARTGIQRFNAHHGGPPDRYHESLTRFWMHICHAFLNEIGLQPLVAARALVSVYGRRSDLYKEYYSYDVLHSPEAITWVRWYGSSEIPATTVPTRRPSAVTGRA